MYVQVKTIFPLNFPSSIIILYTPPLFSYLINLARNAFIDPLMNYRRTRKRRRIIDKRRCFDKYEI